MLSREFRLLLIILIMVSALFGCESLQQREQIIQEKYPDWSPETVQKVAAREVEPGMTPEMVVEALGRKPDTQMITQKDVTVWTYDREVMYGESPRWEPTFFVYFEDGKVIRTQGDSSLLGRW